MRVAVTGATGLIGSRLLGELGARGDEVTVLSREPERARHRLPGVAHIARWRPEEEPAPAEALAGRDGVVHLAGENLAQRWTDAAKARIRRSRELGTRNLVAGLRAVGEGAGRPSVLVSQSAVGYYGPHGDEPVDEETPPGSDFLAEVCKAWEREAEAASALGVRVVRVRSGVVLDRRGGALSKMLLPFQLGVGGPVAGGRQYLAWIHADDVVGIMVAALSDPTWSGPVNATAPEPVTNKVFSKALGRALRRPAIAPVPEFALRTLYGEMAELVVSGQRVLPRRAQALGYSFRHPDLDEALGSALAKG